jgi:G6PDH family F420-dependent oxidoreductase
VGGDSGEIAMVEFGYKLAAEAYSPDELVRQAVRAEEAGFAFVEISDHFHPWLQSQGHSPFAWSVLGAIAARTERIGLATGVTCPFMRYHPAIVAQAAATLDLLSGGRFTLGVGAGERLNEHVVGRGFPEVTIRHRMLRDAIEIIRALWSGEDVSYEGQHLRLEDARLYDVPVDPPQLVVAAGGPDAAALAAELGDGMFAVEPDPKLIEAYRSHGGEGACYAEATISWAETGDEALDSAWSTARWSLLGWKVMSELPSPVNFEAASEYVRPEDVAGKVPVGPDLAGHADAVAAFVDAGYDHIALMNLGPDPDGFFDFYRAELGPELEARVGARV